MVVGDSDNSLQIEVRERNPDHLLFRHLRVSTFESAGRHEHAAAECQSILNEHPDDATTLGYLAHLQLEMGRPADAIETIDRALDTFSAFRQLLIIVY